MHVLARGYKTKHMSCYEAQKSYTWSNHGQMCMRSARVQNTYGQTQKKRSIDAQSTEETEHVSTPRETSNRSTQPTRIENISADGHDRTARTAQTGHLTSTRRGIVAPIDASMRRGLSWCTHINRSTSGGSSLMYSCRGCWLSRVIFGTISPPMSLSVLDCHVSVGGILLQLLQPSQVQPCLVISVLTDMS